MAGVRIRRTTHLECGFASAKHQLIECKPQRICRLTFSAVGDNLANDNILALADSWAGSPGDGAYDFSPFYAEVAPVVRDGYDVSFINQETVLGGTETFDYMSYPSYNTPDSMADAVVAAGWRVVNLGTNHTYDIWTDGIEHALDILQLLL